MEAKARRGGRNNMAFPTTCLGHQQTRRELMRKRLRFTKTEGMAIRKRIEKMAKGEHSIVTGAKSRAVIAKAKVKTKGKGKGKGKGTKVNRTRRKAP
jgi:hypothetical protein